MIKSIENNHNFLSRVMAMITGDRQIKGKDNDKLEVFQINIKIDEIHKLETKLEAVIKSIMEGIEVSSNQLEQLRQSYDQVSEDNQKF